MSCSPYLCGLSSCSSRQSRAQSVCSTSCSSPCSRTSSPCSRPCLSPCTPCYYPYYCLPCNPCSKPPSCKNFEKRREKISDFAGGGLASAPDLNKNDKGKQKQGKGGKKGGNKTSSGKKENGSKSGKGGKSGRSKSEKNGDAKDDGGDGTKTNKDKGKKDRKGSKKDGDENKSNKDDNVGGAGGGKRASSNAKDSSKDNQGNNINNQNTTDLNNKLDNKKSVDVGVCTPRLPKCPCPNPYCPSNLRNGNSAFLSTIFNPMAIQQSYNIPKSKHKCYCRRKKEETDQKVSSRDVKPIKICCKCGKKKRQKPKTPENDNERNFYVKNDRFSPHSCPQSGFFDEPLIKTKCSHLITLLTQNDEMLGYHISDFVVNGENKKTKKKKCRCGKYSAS